MGPPIIALVLSLTAVAAFPFYPYYNPDVIDVFQAFPHHGGRGFMDWNPYEYDEYSPYGMEFRRDHYGSPQFTLEDIFESPVAIVTPSHVVPNTLSVFYVHAGLRSLPLYNSFSWLREYMRMPGLKGLIFSPHRLYNSRFFNMPISGIFVPDDFKVFDLFDPQINRANIPYMFVAPEAFFDALQFNNIAKVFDFKVRTGSIEALPAFYGSATGASASATAASARGGARTLEGGDAGPSAGSTAASAAATTSASNTAYEAGGILVASNEVAESVPTMSTATVAAMSAASIAKSEVSTENQAAAMSSAVVPLITPSDGSVTRAFAEGVETYGAVVRASPNSVDSETAFGDTQTAAAPEAATGDSQTAAASAAASEDSQSPAAFATAVEYSQTTASSATAIGESQTAAAPEAAGDSQTAEGSAAVFGDSQTTTVPEASLGDPQTAAASATAIEASQTVAKTTDPSTTSSAQV